MITEDIKNKKIHNIRCKKILDRPLPDFHISGLSDDTIIDIKNGGLDDAEEFNCSMYNFGEMDNLPDSDRAMIPGNRTCKEYRP